MTQALEQYAVGANTPEHVFGSFETIELLADQYVKMSQVRGERNSVSHELKESIASVGLVNPIDVARMDEAALTEYVTFVNQIWGSKTCTDDFAPQRQDDGVYYLVIAGHSRHQAITELQEEGVFSAARIAAKVHRVTSPQQIIAIQLAENIHSQPPRERRATAIVETYEWGLATGRWRSQREFLAIYKDSVGKSPLQEALSFASLPASVRNFVFARKLSYTAGVELGRAADDVRDHIMFRADITDSEDRQKHRDSIEGLLEQELIIRTNYIISRRMNSTAAQKYVQAWRRQLQDEMYRDGQEAMFELATSAELLDQQRRDKQKIIAAFLREYAQSPARTVVDIVSLHEGIVSDETLRQVEDDLYHNLQKAHRKLASPALRDMADPSMI